MKELADLQWLNDCCSYIYIHVYYGCSFLRTNLVLLKSHFLHRKHSQRQTLSFIAVFVFTARQSVRFSYIASSFRLHCIGSLNHYFWCIVTFIFLHIRVYVIRVCLFLIIASSFIFEKRLISWLENIKQDNY